MAFLAYQVTFALFIAFSFKESVAAPRSAEEICLDEKARGTKAFDGSDLYCEPVDYEQHKTIHLQKVTLRNLLSEAKETNIDIAIHRMNVLSEWSEWEHIRSDNVEKLKTILRSAPVQHLITQQPLGENRKALAIEKVWLMTPTAEYILVMNKSPVLDGGAGQLQNEVSSDSATGACPPGQEPSDETPAHCVLCSGNTISESGRSCRFCGCGFKPDASHVKCIEVSESWTAIVNALAAVLVALLTFASCLCNRPGNCPCIVKILDGVVGAETIHKWFWIKTFYHRCEHCRNPVLNVDVNGWPAGTGTIMCKDHAGLPTFKEMKEYSERVDVHLD